MLTPDRALGLNIEAGRELPRVPAFQVLYDWGCRPRQGEVIMIAGRSGSQKSGFALFWVAEMARIAGTRTLYYSADMSGFTASARLASTITGDTTEQIEVEMAVGNGQRYFDALRGLPITFAFGSPIKWDNLYDEIEAGIELWDQYYDVIVLDNLMDFENAESDYTEQMAVMQGVTELARDTGSTVIILHHASDKAWEAKSSPWKPPSRQEVKGGLSEKPELALSIALDPQSMDLNVAVIKQRMGRSDPSANDYVTLRAEPERTRFHDRAEYIKQLKERRAA